LRQVLVDSSVWIDYFRNGSTGPAVDSLLDAGSVVTNGIVLAELVPALLHRGEVALAGLLRRLPDTGYVVDWEELIRLQNECLAQGISRVGIPDLILLADALQHALILFSLDRHFVLMEKHFVVTLYSTS
jgi:predicted nucleic acid-binding protein